MKLSLDHPTMSNFTIKQPQLFYCYTLPLEQINKLNKFLAVLERSGVGEIIKKVVHENSNGRPGYDPYAMLATVIYGFAVGAPSLRELESSCAYDLRFKYLMNNAEPDHSSFCRFINEVVKPNADAIFSCLTKEYLCTCNIIADDCHIDGTKFEAKPNKYKTVWKPITYHNKLSEKIRILLSNLGLSEDVPVSGIIPSRIIADKLSAVAHLDRQNLSPEELKMRQRDIQNLTNCLGKSLEYEEKETICGPGRNSYYKTDHDATAMCLKADYYSGLGSSLHAAYQIQCIVSHGMIVTYYVSQDRTDMHAFIPTVERFYESYGRYPCAITADSGYGCYENYKYCKDKGIEAFIKYLAWAGEANGKRPALFHLNDIDTITCIAGKVGYRAEIPERHHKVKDGRFYIVRCRNLCPFKIYCRRLLKEKKGRTRTFEIRPNYELLKNEARDKLLSPRGIEMRVNRSCQNEGTFGVVKQNMGYTRIRRVGIHQVKTEFMLTLLGLNTRKLFRFFDGKDPFTYWKAPEGLHSEQFKKPSAKRLTNKVLKKKVLQPNEIARNSYRRKRGR